MLSRSTFAHVFTAAALTLAAASSAQAWTWNLNWGGGEQVKGSGMIVSETRELDAFDAISLSGDLQVRVRQGATTRVEVRADNNLLPLIETRIVEGSKGRTLEIGPKKGYNLAGTTREQITLQMPQLRRVAVGGSGDVRVEAMNTPSVDASIGGSGKIVFVDVTSQSMTLSVAGSGDVEVSGRTGNLSLSVAGSGDVNARSLAADVVKASVAGSGSAQVHAIKTLRVSIAGSGDIAYLGSPEVISSVAGSGNVSRLSR